MVSEGGRKVGGERNRDGLAVCCTGSRERGRVQYFLLCQNRPACICLQPE